MIHSNPLRCLVAAAAFATMPALAQTSPAAAQSATTTQEAIANEKNSTGLSTSAQPASGVRNPGVVTNSLDATGTFSSGPAATPAPGLAIDPNTGLSGNANLNARSDATLSTPPATVNMLPPAAGSATTLPSPEPVKP